MNSYEYISSFEAVKSALIKYFTFSQFLIKAGKSHKTYGSLSLFPPYSKKGGHSEMLLNTCIAHSNSADLLLSNDASDWLSGDFDNNLNLANVPNLAHFVSANS